MRIVVLDGYGLNPGDMSWEPLKELGETLIYDRTPDDLIIERAGEAEIIITNKTPITEDTLSKLPNLKYVGILATGYNIVDISAANKRNVVVTNIPAYSTDSVGQMVFALLLELCHHVKDHSDAVRRGDWSTNKDFTFWNYPLIELAGKNIGIIGFGKIGQKVADIAQVFGMNILAYSRTETDQSHRSNFKWVETLDELLKVSDVVSLHCPLFEETRGLINKESLRKMKNTAFLINTSRGPVVVEEDLAQALNDGVVAGAGLDVLSKEPPEQDNPLLKAKNCIITPHIAWATNEARERLMSIALNNIKAFLDKNPINIIKG